MSLRHYYDVVKPIAYIDYLLDAYIASVKCVDNITVYLLLLLQNTKCNLTNVYFTFYITTRLTLVTSTPNSVLTDKVASFNKY